nr:carbohydrate ABC transporter permease [Actinoplanes digitatis]
MSAAPNRRPRPNYLLSAVAIVAALVVFVVPFVFIVLTAVKDRRQAAEFDFSWPQGFHLVRNLVDVVQARDYLLIIAYINSTILTVASVTIMAVTSAMVAYVLQRRRGRWNGLVNFLVLSGLIIPLGGGADHLGAPAPRPVPHDVRPDPGGGGVRPGLLRAAVPGVHRGDPPRELDEAAIIDGASPVRLFFQVIFPLLRPVIVTVVLVQSVFVYNDFVNPLYFLPGEQNATVQLTLYNFNSQFNTQYNLLFMDILLITIPPLLMFVAFNRQIVAGMTAGAIKG